MNLMVILVSNVGCFLFLNASDTFSGHFVCYHHLQNGEAVRPPLRWFKRDTHPKIAQASFASHDRDWIKSFCSEEDKVE